MTNFYTRIRVFKTPCVINIIYLVIQKELFDCVICETSSESQKVYFNYNWKPGLVFKYFKNELNVCKDFGSEDKLYCGTYCYNSCSTFSRSESGAEARSQTFEFLLDILNQNQVVEQVFTDI